MNANQISNLTINKTNSPIPPGRLASYIAGYTVIFIISLIGNVVVTIVTLHKKMGRTPIDILIFALAANDLIITITIPFVAVTSIQQVFIFGNVMCKLLFGFRSIAIYAAALILIAIGVERYRATFNLSRYRGNLRHVLIAITIIWIIAIALAFPQFIVLHVTKFGMDDFCVELWPTSDGQRVYSLFMLIFTFLAPFLIITACNIAIAYKLFYGVKHREHLETHKAVRKTKHQIVTVMIIVSIIFFACLLPIYMVNTLFDFKAITYQGHIVTLYDIFTWIAYSHSMWNPIIYVIGSSKMRKDCKKLFLDRWSKRRNSTATLGSAAKYGGQEAKFHMKSQFLMALISKKKITPAGSDATFSHTENYFYH